MRSVETILRELFDLIEDRSSIFFGDTTFFPCPLDELVAVALHQFDLLLTHRLAQVVGIVHRESCEHVGDLHHLFLVNDDAVGGVEDRFESRMKIFNLFTAVFAVAVQIVHTGSEWAWPVESQYRDHVLEPIRFEVAQKFAHSRALQLKDPVGLTVAKHFEGGFVIERHLIDIDLGPLLFDDSTGSIDDGEVA